MTNLDRIIDHGLPHIDDAVSADVGDGAPVEATQHPLLPFYGQVGVHNTLNRGSEIGLYVIWKLTLYCCLPPATCILT